MPTKKLAKGGKTKYWSKEVMKKSNALDLEKVELRKLFGKETK